MLEEMVKAVGEIPEEGRGSKEHSLAGGELCPVPGSFHHSVR